MTTGLRSLAAEPFCYLTTTGRVTGRPHNIEIWFALNGRTLHMLSGNGPHHRSDWVRNLVRTPDVSVRIRDQEISGTARIVKDAAEDALARRLLFEKYAPTYAGDLTEWRESALPVAVDLVA
ncbi:MAG TPA: nitroreductase/quinone reductase family protein [Dehalococcoidia bacterium]|nr:nitroreductase/quinone reductase family protein [Dehalococcoidia bacterium]